MNLGLRGVMDAEGDIHVWPTILLDHNQAFATFGPLADYRVRFRQWGNKPGDPIDFDRGSDRADMIRVCEHVLRMQDPSAAATPEGVLDFARRSGVR